MSADFVSLGPDARVAVNGVMFAVTGGQYRDAADEVDPTDSESAVDGFRTVETGLRHFECTLNANRSTDVTPHLSPLSLSPTRGQTVHLQLYPDGVSLPGYDVPEFKVTDGSGNWNVSGSQIQTISITGKSRGAYTRTGE